MSEPPCECDNNGFEFPWHADLAVAGVVRCDLCCEFSSDEAAAKALADKLPAEYKVGRLRRRDRFCYAVCLRQAEFDSTRPLTFEEGLKLYNALVERGALQ